jgi:uncharacterized protein (TIGR03118 family)
MRTAITLAFAATLLTTIAWTGAEAGTVTTYQVTPLVSDQEGVAPNTDTDLVNPWGLAQATDSAPVWVSDNATNKSTIYNRTTGIKQSPVVNIPNGAPTGIAYAPPGSGFSITENGRTSDSIFLFDTESGAIEGWTSSVDPDNAVIAVDRSAEGDVYKGLALDTATHLLFAADFANNRVRVFDNQFNLVNSFTDKSLPRRFAPFNVAMFNGNLYVAFAKRERGGTDEVAGKGLGYIDVFTTGGVLVTHLVANGSLNAPWGMTVAPSSFGTFSGALLVGNFGDGKINAFDPATGDHLGKLARSDGRSLRIDGLWALDAGPGSGNVMFSAGPKDETHGLLGLISPSP